MSPRNNLGIFDTTLGGSWLSWCYNLRQVQEAVDELLRTGSVDAGRPLKSLLDGLKRKKRKISATFTWETCRLFWSLCYCHWSETQTSSVWSS